MLEDDIGKDNFDIITNVKKDNFDIITDIKEDKFKTLQDIEKKYNIICFKKIENATLDVFNEKINEDNILTFEKTENFSDILVSFGIYANIVLGDNVKALMYFLKAIDLKNDFGTLCFGLYHLTNDIYDTAEAYILKLQNSEIINHNYYLGICYINKALYKITDKDVSKKFLEKAIECLEIKNEKNEKNEVRNNVDGDIAWAYESLNNYEKAIFYYKKSYKNGYYKMLNDLAIIYEKLKMNDEAVEFYADSVIKNCEDAKKRLSKMIDVKIQYKILSEINEPNEFVIKELNILRNNKQINNFICNLSFSKKRQLIEECPVCYTNELQIFYSCFHSCCADCYVRTKECPLCRTH